MKILIVHSGNVASSKHYTFIKTQEDALRLQGCKTDFFQIKGKGLLGYIKSRKKLLLKIKEFQPDIIHAHYGLSGLLANLQCKIPVVTTYHGSDINNPKVLRFSKISVRLSKFNIFVSQKNIDIVKPKKSCALIPCGVDTEQFKPLDKIECREKLGLKNNEKLVLFSGGFDKEVKNPALAKSAVALLSDVKLLELKGYTREQVCWLMNAVDAVLMTSRTEGSPQFIKEALAVNCPIVSVDVGDVKEVVGNTENGFICFRSEKVIAEALKEIFQTNKRTNGRNRIVELKLDNKDVAEKLINIYNNILINR
jgi:glycosyltransferase involved in cell wall biosynthesis